MRTADHVAGVLPDALILVTGASGFVGGHVARALAESGYRVRALTRRPPPTEPWDPPIDWMFGDLRNAEDRSRALEGVRGVVHSAGWVSFGVDPHGESRVINVGATRALLEQGRAAGVERFLYTSSIWAVASGSAEEPADEESPWNLERLRSPYSDTKREAEQLVLEHDRPGFRTMVLSPAMVLGPRDVRPTSTRVLLHMARTPVAILPLGGTPVIDARVVARAHVLALERGEPGRRYILAGPYLSYQEIAALVTRVTGYPRRVVTVPDIFERPMTWVARRLDHLTRGRWPELSGATVAGGFLRFHVSGAQADAAFELDHPPPIQSIFDALSDFCRSGRAPWLNPRRPTEDDLVASPLTLP